MTSVTTLFLIFLLFAKTAPNSLDEVKAEPNLEKRARAAIEFAAVAEKMAEAAYEKGDLDATGSNLKIMTEGVETAKASLEASGKTPGRNPGPYKFAEQKSHEILLRLGDLEDRMDEEERHIMAAAKARVQEIHDEWFEGIMERKR